MTEPTIDFRPLLTEPTPRAARVIALHLLDVLDAEHDRLGRPGDTEALHDFRVALRRLRSWLRAYRRDVKDSVGKKAGRQLAEIGRVTTDSRDIEVHLEWLARESTSLRPADRAGEKWLRTRLTADKARADAAFREDMGERYTHLSARLRKNLARYAVAVWDQDGTDRWAVTAATQVQDGFLTLRRRLGAIADVNDDRSSHRARIAGKRLRYLLEPLDGVVAGVPECVERLKRLQDLLGSVHDGHVFARLLRRHAGAPARGQARTTRRTPARTPATGLRTLERRLHARRNEAWLEFTDEWLERQFAELGTMIHSMVRELREIGGAGVEIERKYLLSRLPPEAKDAPVEAIEQGFLPGRTLIERLRRSTTADGTKYLRTVKTGSGLVRTEIEEETTADVFAAMWPLTKGKRLTKRRYALADAGHVWQIDDFTDRKLVLAEIELTSAREEVVIPDWLNRCLVREVTGDVEYLNYTLAR